MVIYLRPLVDKENDMKYRYLNNVNIIDEAINDINRGETELSDYSIEMIYEIEMRSDQYKDENGKARDYFCLSDYCGRVPEYHEYRQQFNNLKLLTKFITVIGILYIICTVSERLYLGYQELIRCFILFVALYITIQVINIVGLNYIENKYPY